MKTRIILVGGFLGAGKTSLLFETARKLREQGKRVGLITNDQASELVDTTFLEYTKGSVQEVSGSCFCCNFKGLTDAISHLIKENQADIIIAEPVGSCTDLSATILQPLKDFHQDLIVAPLTVLIDPERLSDLFEGEKSGLHASASYIIRKQLEEADLIVINKSDLLTPEQLQLLKQKAAESWPAGDIHVMSVKTGAGLYLWLDEVTNREDAGTHLAEVDYDIYAEGEAVLGWLNATIHLQGDGVNWDHFAKELMNGLSGRFDKLQAAVGHVKLLLKNKDSFVIGNITGKKDSLNLRESAGSGDEAELTLNARVQMVPADLEKIVFDELAKAGGNAITATIVALKCLSPGRPNPTYRYDRVVTPAT